MMVDFYSSSLSTLKQFLSNKTNWKNNTFSLGKNSFVLKDTMSERLVLYTGPAQFSGRLKSIGPAQVRLLKGNVTLNILPFEISLDQQRTSRRYQPISKAREVSLCIDEVKEFKYTDAIDIYASKEAIWLIKFEKSIQYSTCVTFDAKHLKVERLSLLYHGHSRLFNYVEVLARSTCEQSLKALKLLTASPIDELAWRAIEGIYFREQSMTIHLLREYTTTHASKVIQNRADIFLRSRMN